MTWNKALQSANGWLSAPAQLTRLQRFALLYGALFFAVTVVLSWLSPGLAYGAKGVVGGDFLAFYTAGDMSLDGRALQAYEFEAFDAALQTRVESDHLGMMWQYPPVMFFLVSLLALMPYKFSLWVWVAGTGVVFVWALNRLVSFAAPDLSARRMTVFLVLASPLCLMVVTSGQISLLTAALLMTAVFRPNTHWLAAGLAAGLLTIKPQLGVLIPLVFITAGAWRAFAVAAVTATALHAVSFIVFGPEAFSAFFEAVARLQSDVAGSGTHTPPENMTTLFGQLRDWQVPSAIAMPLQIVSAAAVFVAVTWLWRQHSGDPDRALYLAALLGTGAVLVTPYAYAYEMAALAPVAIWLAFQAERYRKIAIVLLTAGWALLTLREFLPLDTLIQMPFLISTSAFLLLLSDAVRAPNARSTTA